MLDTIGRSVRMSGMKARAEDLLPDDVESLKALIEHERARHSEAQSSWETEMPMRCPCTVRAGSLRGSGWKRHGRRWRAGWCAVASWCSRS